jgi:hypothetical protein
LTQSGTQQTPKTFVCDCDSSINTPGLLHVSKWTEPFRWIKACVNLQLKQVRKKSLQQDEQHLPLVPYCINQRNKHLYSSFPLPLIAYKLTGHSNQIKQRYHEPWTLLLNWNVNNIWENTGTYTVSSKLHSTVKLFEKNKSRIRKLEWNINKIKITFN